MVSESQAHAAEDKIRRETIEARNTADSQAYQLERTLRELGAKVPINEKARSEALIEETRKASCGREYAQRALPAACKRSPAGIADDRDRCLSASRGSDRRA